MRVVPTVSVCLAVALLGGCSGSGDAETEPGTPSASPPASSASAAAGGESTAGGSRPDAGPTFPVSGAGAAVPRALFGMQVNNLGTDGGPVPPRAGAVRLWDSGVSWRLIEPTRGRVTWGRLDRAVERAEGMGATEILWVHGSTPRWAATEPDAPGLYGPGTSSAPDEGAYLAILRKVAERYRGRITAYQAWNEANLSDFYSGTPEYLARLTARAREVLRAADPKARLVGASTTVRAPGPLGGFYDAYARALAERGWPVDAMTVHLYPRATEGPTVRDVYIRMMHRWLLSRGWRGPVWDTEINYGDRRESAKEVVVVPPDRGAAWVARTYLDSLALGVERVFWYAWNSHILGIDMVQEGTGRILPPGRAYLTVQAWLAGARWRGCVGEIAQPTGRDAGVTQCALTTADGRPARILYSHRGTATLPMPTGAVRVCRLDSRCSPASGEVVEVDISPILVRLA